jgi:hypothetical protein
MLSTRRRTLQLTSCSNEKIDGPPGACTCLKHGGCCLQHSSTSSRKKICSEQSLAASYALPRDFDLHNRGQRVLPHLQTKVAKVPLNGPDSPNSPTGTTGSGKAEKCVCVCACVCCVRACVRVCV